MKYAGMLLLPAGFFLTAAALVLFPAGPDRTGFAVGGLAVEALGLGLAIRGHMARRGEERL
jgi:hypothetical protein